MSDDTAWCSDYWWVILRNENDLLGKNYDFWKWKSVIVPFCSMIQTELLFIFTDGTLFLKRALISIFMKESAGKWFPGCGIEKRSLTFLSSPCPHCFQHYPNERGIGKSIRCLAIAWRVPDSGFLSWHISSITGPCPFFLCFLLIFLTSFSRRIWLLPWLI